MNRRSIFCLLLFLAAIARSRDPVFIGELDLEDPIVGEILYAYDATDD
jgi:hypothetical protein